MWPMVTTTANRSRAARWAASPSVIAVALMTLTARGDDRLTGRGPEADPAHATAQCGPTDPPCAICQAGSRKEAPRVDPKVARASGPSSPEPEVRYNEVPTPGARITVGVGGVEEAGTSFRWTQVEGPPVAIDDATAPRIRFTVPPDAKQLGFLLTLKVGQQERTVRVTVPVRQPREPAVAEGAPKADAGDDQVALVGRRITLSGLLSSPRGQVEDYRWIQVAGPKVSQAVQDRGYFSFVPTSAGVCRFVLVVAANRQISEPDEVSVVVAEYPSEPSATDRLMSGFGATQETTSQVADVFDAIAERAGLYTTFADLSSELTRRLDALIPKDPQSRLLWSQTLFIPMTRIVIEEMLPTGLDLRLPQGHHQDLGPAQQEKLRTIFRSFARAFRSRAAAR
jgi:hypothetical protein